MLVFLPLSPSLWFNSPSPLPCVNKYTVLYTRIQCVRGRGLWDSGPQTDTHLPQSPELQVNFLAVDILHCLLQYKSYLSTFRGITCMCTIFVYKGGLMIS
jgi:hypothetical protein